MNFTDFGPHIYRTILMYFLVYCAIRVMGKREIGKLSMFDLVVSIMLAEMGAFVIEDIKKPFSWDCTDADSHCYANWDGLCGVEKPKAASDD